MKDTTTKAQVEESGIVPASRMPRFSGLSRTWWCTREFGSESTRIMNDRTENESSGDTGNNARRWRPRSTTVAVLGCLTIVIGWVLWSIFRPLNDSERRLVGIWRNKTSPAVINLHADRTVSYPGHTDDGTWYMVGDKLYFPDAFWEESLRTLLFQQRDHSSIVTFDNEDQITLFVPINGGTFHWERLPSSVE